MIDVMGREGLAELAAMARQRVLVALDFDGTLAPIVSRPELAAMRDSTRSRLEKLSKRYPVILLTGRARADGLARLSGISLLEVIGSHGIESQGTVASGFLKTVAHWRAELSDRIRALKGVELEDKRFSLSIHYRNAEQPELAEAAIAAAAGQLPRARIIGGKKVVNILPDDGPDKGAALVSACRRQGYRHAIYVGDDDTDEAAFAIHGQEEVLGIRVGGAPQSRARFFLQSQERIDDLLEQLILFRSTLGRGPSRGSG